MTAIRIAQWEDEQLKFTIKQNGTAVDITGATVDFYVYSGIDGSELLDITGSIITAASGTCKATISSAQSALLDVGRHYCELWITDISGNKIQALEPTPFFITPKLEIPA